MSALIDPVASGKSGYANFLRVAQKRIDYGIATPDFDLVAIIELDDRSHNRQKDESRDALVASAGIPTIRFDSRCRPDLERIRLAVLPASAATEGHVSTQNGI